LVLPLPLSSTVRLYVGICVVGGGVDVVGGGVVVVVVGGDSIVIESGETDTLHELLISLPVGSKKDPPPLIPVEAPALPTAVYEIVATLPPLDPPVPK
jgi:hypothetical protein